MISRVIDNSVSRYKCKIICIPNRFFYFLVSPLKLFSLNKYDAIYRIGADLSGFNKVNELMKTDEKSISASIKNN